MTVSDTIQEWIDGVNKDLVSQYDSDGRRASGNWEKELEGTQEKTPKGYRITILGSYYTYWMENGRRPNKNQNWESIKKIAGWLANSTNGPIYQWCKNKGIMTAYAFPVAVKVLREGYQGKPTTGAVLTKECIEELIRKVGLAYAGDIKSDIIKELKV